MRPIDADELLTAFPVDDEPTLTKSCVRMTIQHMPTVDAVPVRHGRWTIEDCHAATYPYCCSNCTAHHRARYDYCPSCGAKMDGKDGDDHES